MKEEFVELIVLLNGNFVPFALKSSDMDKYNKILADAIKAGIEDKTFYIQLAPTVVILTNSIVGWYFRPKAEAPTEKMMKFLDKKLPDANEGDDWKNED